MRYRLPGIDLVFPLQIVHPRAVLGKPGGGSFYLQQDLRKQAVMGVPRTRNTHFNL